jgi:hypothetical protein
MPGARCLVPCYSSPVQRRHHFESAFESLLRARRVPYIAINEARKSLLPSMLSRMPQSGPALKSFDFIAYGHGGNLLIEIKGRTLRPPTRPHPQVLTSDALPLRHRRVRPAANPRLECWATRDDIESLLRWQELFGPEFESVLIFLYCWQAQPADALYHDVFEHRGQWYSPRVVSVRDYAAHMRTRSAKWGTVDLAPATYRALSRPFVGDQNSFTTGPDIPALELYSG